MEEVDKLPNIKSAKKRVKVGDTKNAQKGIGSRQDSRSNDNDKQYTGKSSGQ